MARTVLVCREGVVPDLAKHIDGKKRRAKKKNPRNESRLSVVVQA